MVEKTITDFTFRMLNIIPSPTDNIEGNYFFLHMRNTNYLPGLNKMTQIRIGAELNNSLYHGNFVSRILDINTNLNTEETKRSSITSLSYHTCDILQSYEL